MQKHSTLLDRQRAYFKAVKEFQEECGTNERLVTGLEGMQVISVSFSLMIIP